MYSGTFKTSDSADNHLFYMFFRNTNPSAPLGIWMNGGPGFSSMFGLFIENGPLWIEKDRVFCQ